MIALLVEDAEASTFEQAVRAVVLKNAVAFSHHRVWPCFLAFAARSNTHEMAKATKGYLAYSGCCASFGRSRWGRPWGIEAAMQTVHNSSFDDYYYSKSLKKNAPLFFSLKYCCSNWVCIFVMPGSVGRCSSDDSRIFIAKANQLFHFFFPLICQLLKPQSWPKWD